MTFRAASVSEIISQINKYVIFLIQSSPFTGKTSLLELVADELVRQKEKVITLSLLGYSPQIDNLSDFVVKKLNIPSYETIFKPKERTYLLIDEYQKLYPLTAQSIQECYSISTERVATAAANHIQWMENLKEASQNEHFRCLCFSGYCCYKRATIASTPPSITTKTTKYAKFTDQEMGELFSDFTLRTQISCIRQNSQIPPAFQLAVQELSGNHVGYTSAIIHFVNDNAHCVKTEEDLLTLLKSPRLYQFLLPLRPTSTYSGLDDPEKELLKLFLINTSVPQEDKWLSLLCRGWVSILNPTEPNSPLCLPSSLSRQLLLMSVYGKITPKAPGQITSLENLLNGFLQQISKKILQETLRLLTVPYEAFWQVWYTSNH